MNSHFAIALAHDHHQELRNDADNLRLARQASARPFAGTGITTRWNRWRGRAGRPVVEAHSLAAATPCGAR